MIVDGEPPALAGLSCEDLLAQEYYHEGKLVEPANVVYLRFGGAWHRLYFDSSVVFWRLHDGTPESPPAEEWSGYALVDLGRRFGLRGIILDRMEVVPVTHGSEVRFEFQNGVILVFSEVDDITTYRLARWASGERTSGTHRGE